MKTQKFAKKLILTKETITNLNDRQQEAVQGGLITIANQHTTCSCITLCNQYTCCGSVDACSC